MSLTLCKVLFLKTAVHALLPETLRRDLISCKDDDATRITVEPSDTIQRNVRCLQTISLRESHLHPLHQRIPVMAMRGV